MYKILTVICSEHNTWEFQNMKLRLQSTHFVDVGRDGKQDIQIVSCVYLSGSQFARTSFLLSPIAQSL